MPKKKQSPSSDKSLHGPPEDKLQTLSRDQATLERNAQIGVDGPRSDHKTVTCYNPACPDYRRPRTDGSSCGCKKSAVGSLT